MALDVFDENNVGGLLSIELALAEEILNDDPLDFIAQNTLKIYFTSRTAVFREKQKRNQAGTNYSFQIDFVLPKRRNEVLDWIQTNQNQYWVAIVKDSNQFSSKVGKKIKPLVMEIDFDSGRTVSDRNEFQISLKGNSLKAAEAITQSTSLSTTTIMYQSLSIALIANTPLVYQMPLDMDLSTLICQFYSGAEEVIVDAYNINNSLKQITLLSAETISITMNAITKA